MLILKTHFLVFGCTLFYAALRVACPIVKALTLNPVSGETSSSPHRDTRTVDGVNYRLPYTNSDRSVQFSHMKLENSDDVRAMFSVTIELDASIRPMTYEEIKACMDIESCFNTICLCSCLKMSFSL